MYTFLEVRHMKIYKQEKIDGIADLVKSQASVAYCAQASVVSKDEEVEQSDAIKKLMAGKSNPDQIDLYYLESVLVSTGWNKNDDVFMAQATWEARSTPEDKQFNFMHNENDIIGHITGCYVLGQDGKKISEEQQDAPQKFDIISEAVLYNSWTDPDNRNRMQQIIAEIEEGKWFVSMECLFAGFDYALVDPDKVLSRDEQSAFLTKHLRAYGGTGKYEGYTIGRALRNISFSGKGLVAKPANPRSIIINNNSTKAFHIEHNDDNKFSIGDLPMSDNQNLLETQVAGLKQDLAAAQEENKAIKAKIEEAKDKEFAATIEAFEADVTSKNEAIAELEETIKSTQARIAELEDALAQSQEELTTSQAEVEEMHKKEKAAIRKAALVEAGLEEKEAEESLANFDALEDEAFDAVVALMAPKKPKAKDDKENPFDKKKKEEPEEKAKKKYAADETEAAEEEATDETEAAEEAEAELEEAFEEVESTEATLVEPEADELQDTRASIADWISSNVLNK